MHSADLTRWRIGNRVQAIGLSAEKNRQVVAGFAENNRTLPLRCNDCGSENHDNHAGSCKTIDDHNRCFQIRSACAVSSVPGSSAAAACSDRNDGGLRREDLYSAAVSPAAHQCQNEREDRTRGYPADECANISIGFLINNLLLCSRRACSTSLNASLSVRHRI